MSEPTGPAAPTPPAVDHPDVAAALRLVADLDDQPLDQHHERLSRVHEVLHGVLHPGPPAR
ncbi:hypothetical protein SAMN04488543_1405 [Friedmanniella luteola]|uniref:Uncharacterized protein n=1 Tax=Friedmanniella luteola TaxID=546871 RepID=A0A1H1QU38_9ACTN|nr:hypothetical protein [Friedmanniella luteola]SDS27012.1 hypothetical protein SAMN04488543_1405 [Friedmanniella luteola]